MRSVRGRGAKSIALAWVVVASCSGGGDATVEMTDDREFAPETLTVAVGETVTFVNPSDEAHTVTAYSDAIPEGASYWASGGAASENEARADLAAGLIPADETFEIVLEAPGTYRYFCIPHEKQGMVGTIEVRE